MEIKKFNSFLNEDNYIDGDKSFEDKLREDYDIVDQVKSILKLALEKINNTKTINDIDEFRDTIFESLNVDATDLVDFDLDKQIDLCIYADEQDQSGCPETKWEDIVGVINNTAILGLSYICQDVIGEKFFEPFEKFMEENDLEYSDISWIEKYGHSRPSKVISIENGEIYQYRKLDGDFNVDEYVYTDDEFNINIYIKKII